MREKFSIKNFEVKKDIIKYYIQLASVFIISAVILFAVAGTFNWFWAWVFILIFPVYTLINHFVLSKELLAERGRKKVNTKKWDKILTPIGIVPSLGIVLIAGLDKRFVWAGEISVNIHIIALIIYIAGDIIVTWAMASNKYFSTVVRIQTERGHKTVIDGPYKFIRHPGYLGTILNALSAPLILGSYWALIPAFILALLFVIRIVFEDITLQKELEGYEEFTEKVKYKLLPGIW